MPRRPSSWRRNGRPGSRARRRSNASATRSRAASSRWRAISTSGRGATANPIRSPTSRRVAHWAISTCASPKSIGATRIRISGSSPRSSARGPRSPTPFRQRRNRCPRPHSIGGRSPGVEPRSHNPVHALEPAAETTRGTRKGSFRLAYATTTPAPSVVAGLKQALKPHSPFAEIDERDLDRLVRASRLAYFAPGETILGPTADRPTQCYVIRQGAVRGERPDRAGSANALWELLAGEMFPLGALVARRGVTSVYRAIQDTFCLVLPVAVFDALIDTSPVFQDFCTRRLAHLLDLARAELQAEYLAATTEQRGFATPLFRLLRRAPLTCGPDTPLADALLAMENERIGSLPIVDGDAKPLGIFTRQDVIGRVVLPQRPLTTPIGDVMSTPVIALPSDATAGDAALLMAASGIRHVVIRDNAGKVAGVVSERDLFTLQRLSVRELASEVRRAADVSALVQCAADIRALSYSLVVQGLAASQLTRMISSLNDQITARLLELFAPQFNLAGLALCWLGMGSEGRYEQTIATDQDNGLIFAPNDPAAAPDAVRERLLPFARAINEALDRCGCPLCKGGVMAMNPRWCASLAEWKESFANWIDRGDPTSLLAASIFFDFRALWGETA